jgi:hypothetical protein
MTCDGQNVDPIASEVRNSVDPIASEAIAKKDLKDLNLKDFNSEFNPTVETRGRAKAKTGNIAFGS